MTNKKNRFFTLVFSCCPGAGEMYLGLYRQGVSLMGLFFGTIALAAWLGFEELIFFICPIVWCYSFFHTHNLRRMTEEEFAAVEDKFIEQRMEMQSQAPPRVRLCIAPDCPFRTVEAGNVPDGAVFLYP